MPKRAHEPAFRPCEVRVIDSRQSQASSTGSFIGISSMSASRLRRIFRPLPRPAQALRMMLCHHRAARILSGAPDPSPTSTFLTGIPPSWPRFPRRARRPHDRLRRRDLRRHYVYTRARLEGLTRARAKIEAMYKRASSHVECYLAAHRLSSRGRGQLSSNMSATQARRLPATISERRRYRSADAKKGPAVPRRASR